MKKESKIQHLLRLRKAPFKIKEMNKKIFKKDLKKLNKALDYFRFKYKDCIAGFDVRRPQGRGWTVLPVMDGRFFRQYKIA